MAIRPSQAFLSSGDTRLVQIVVDHLRVLARLTHRHLKSPRKPARCEKGGACARSAVFGNFTSRVALRARLSALLFHLPSSLFRVPAPALRRDTIIIGGGATNRGVETSVREAFNLDLASIVVRECCWSSDAAAHAYSLDKAMKMYARIRSVDQVTAMLRD